MRQGEPAARELVTTVPQHPLSWGGRHVHTGLGLSGPAGMQKESPQPPKRQEGGL